MNCITGCLIRDILSWWLLHLCVFDSIRVTGDLKIISFHVSIYYLHQRPHTKGVFFISCINLTLNVGGGGGGGRGKVRDLLRVPQQGILEHSHYLKGRQPPLPEPMRPGLVDNWLHRVLSIHEALIVPLILTGF